MNARSKTASKKDNLDAMDLAIEVTNVAQPEEAGETDIADIMAAENEGMHLKALPEPGVIAWPKFGQRQMAGSWTADLLAPISEYWREQLGIEGGGGAQSADGHHGADASERKAA